jgi:hypothetical protein
MTQVRVSVIGTGFGSSVVAPAFAAAEDCEVVEVASPRNDDAVAGLCRRSDVELISVHSPPFLHVQHVRQAIGPATPFTVVGAARSIPADVVMLGLIDNGLGRGANEKVGRAGGFRSGVTARRGSPPTPRSSFSRRSRPTSRVRSWPWTAVVRRSEEDTV